VADSGRRVFATADEEYVVGVIDCATDSLMTKVGTDTRLSAFCLNPTGSRAYCADSSGNTVTVIDGMTHTISAVVEVGPHPVALLHNPAVSKVYCAGSGDYYSPAALSVIDAENDSVVATLVTGEPYEPRVRDLCLNTVNSRVYLSDYEDSRVAVIDPVADTIVTEVAVDYPRLLCYNPVYNYVYVATGLSSVDVIDCGPNTLIATVGVGPSPVALCYVPVGAKVYAAARTRGTVSAIAGKAPVVVADIDVGRSPSALCWNSKENKVYCANSDDDAITVIDASADTIVATLSVGDNPLALSYDLFNDYVYCACRGSNAVYVIDAHRDSVVAQIEVGEEPFRLTWDPIGYRTYVLNQGSGSVSVLRDSLHVGLAEEGVSVLGERRVTPTVVRGVLYLPRDMTELPGNSDRVPRSVLLDISGRKVMDLHSGDNDVRHLAPGVYFIREAEAQARALGVRKVVIAR